jgi:gamma-butyrobetaine dioxygenase/trimethyllysine dioxygenase
LSVITDIYLVTAVEIHADFVRVLAPGRHADFHLRWLRHNCDVDRHPATGERVIDSSELPDELAVNEASIEADALRITWLHDGRTSRFPLAWLEEHAYATDRVATPPPPSDVQLIEIDGSRGIAAEALLARVAERGAGVVRRTVAQPQDETEQWISAIAAHGLSVIGTHFGRIEDLRTDNTTNSNTDQLGYTDAAIGFHTDQPFLEIPPRYQMLQSIRAADRGGDTILGDGEAAFRYLESIDVDAAALLLDTPVRFHRMQKAFEREVISPIITIVDGRAHVRSSYFTVAPYKLPFERVSAWYRAHDTFMRIVRRHHYAFTLQPGDALLYDNRRMLHGRTAFAGPRWVRGVYFDR